MQRESSHESYSYIFHISRCGFTRVEALLSCRLVLNLKRRNHGGHNTSFEQLSTFRGQKFTNEVVLGNIGAPLRSVDEEWDDFIEDTDEMHEEDGDRGCEDVVVG